MLPDVKNTLLQRITITIQLEDLNDEVVNDLYTMLRDSPGTSEVCFHVKDAEGQFHAELKSRNMKASIQKELINYIKSHEGLDYKIN